MSGNVGTGVTFLCVGIAIAIGVSILAYFAQKWFNGIANVWTNWRTLPAILFFYVASTVLVILGIYFMVHSDTHSRHASSGSSHRSMDRTGDAALMTAGCIRDRG